MNGQDGEKMNNRNKRIAQHDSRADTHNEGNIYAQDREFLYGMWRIITEKEENMRLAEALSKETHSPKMILFLKDVFLGIGVRHLFSGMTDVLCLAFAVAVLLAYLAFQRVLHEGDAYAAAFCGSPLLYGFIFLFTWIKETQNGGYELQLSYKYTFFHVMAARMFASSLFGLIFNGLYTVLLLIRFEASGVRLLAVSFSSLMLFSVLLCWSMERGKRFFWAIAAGSVWVLANFLTLFAAPEAYGEALEAIPAYLFLGAGLFSGTVYLRQLLKLTTLSFRKEYTNAAN